MGNKRLFVGNLFPEVSQDDLQERFSKFGSVSKIEIKNKKDIDGNISQTFAFIDIGVSDSQLSQCISTLANKKWKGYLMTVQQARESFMERLARERKEREENEPASKPTDVSPKKVNKRSHEEEEFRIVNNKVPKRDYTEEREAFKGFGRETQKKEKYDPLKLFKSKIAGDENPVPVEEIPNTENMGKVENGIVMFEDDESGKATLLAVDKKYHSSSEEEEENEEDKRVKEKKAKKKVKEDIKSAEFKEKMTQRFLEKQKAIKEAQSGKVENSSKEKSRNKGKVYEDTSDEEDAEEISGKTGADVLKTFQSFSNFWQDSDDEGDPRGNDVVKKEQKKEVTPDSLESDDSDDSDDSSDSDSDDDEQEEKEPVPTETTERKPMQLVSDVSMPRYDPTLEEHQRFHRSNDAMMDDSVKDEVRPNKFFEVKSDLKKVFGSGPEKTGFSFGFNKDQDDKKDSSKEFNFGFGKESADVDSDGEEISVPKKKDNVASKFGLQLKGKGVPKSENTFFFSEEDPRFEEGLSFFFDNEVDLDKLREDFNEKRPILSDILKKRARSKAKRKESLKSSFGKKKFQNWRKGGKRKKSS